MNLNKRKTLCFPSAKKLSSGLSILWFRLPLIPAKACGQPVRHGLIRSPNLPGGQRHFNQSLGVQRRLAGQGALWRGGVPRQVTPRAALSPPPAADRESPLPPARSILGVFVDDFCGVTPSRFPLP